MIRVDQARLPLNYDEHDLWRVATAALRVSPTELTGVTLARRSLDARNKRDIHYTVSLRIWAKNENALLHRARSSQVRKEQAECYRPPESHYSGRFRPIVVGSGPAGLFGALLLAQAGLEPLILERGQMVEERQQDVVRLRCSGAFCSESNIAFGEGGAGTFSDGKLYTGTRDTRHRYITEKFIAAGAAPEIGFEAKPHIGSDVLPRVVTALRREIQDCGGEFCFHTRLSGLRTHSGALCAVAVTDGNTVREVDCDHLLLASGHSADDTYEMLHAVGLTLLPKPFAIGARIEHGREDIDRAQFGRLLPDVAADYKLAVHLDNGRSVYTFCMCPGGVVVPAAAQAGTVVTNGMSNFRRDAENSNSALLVNVTPEDFGSCHPLAGLAFRRKLEQAAFGLAGSDYSAPAQLVGDLLAGRPSAQGGTVRPSYWPGVCWGDLSGCLPPWVIQSLRLGLPLLGRKLQGFDMGDAVLTAPETRSSAPLRILRGENGQSSLAGLWPAGEGAGYSGGIMSSAADGMKQAEKLMQS